jgi:hypothetical protein
MSGTGFMVAALLRLDFVLAKDLRPSIGAPDMLLLLPSLAVGVPQPAAAAAEGVEAPACKLLLLLLCLRATTSPAVLLTLHGQQNHHSA